MKSNNQKLSQLRRSGHSEKVRREKLAKFVEECRATVVADDGSTVTYPNSGDIVEEHDATDDEGGRFCGNYFSAEESEEDQCSKNSE